jgi:recombination protein RecA
MSKAVIQDLESLRAWLSTSGAAARPQIEATVASGLGVLDADLLEGGFPRGQISVLSGLPGTGRMSVAGHVVATETQKGRAAAWIDAEHSLYPPGLARLGVELARLLIVRPAGAEHVVKATELVVDAGAFGVVVLSGLSRSLQSAEARRLHLATRSARVATLVLLEPEFALSSARLVLGFRREARVEVEVLRASNGRSGRRVAL